MVSRDSIQGWAAEPEVMAIPGVEEGLPAVGSAAHDSAALSPNLWGWRQDELHCQETDAPREYSGGYTLGRPSYMAGLEPEARPLLPGYDSGVGALLLGVFLLIALNLRHYSKFFKGIVHEAWRPRVRENLFEDHTVSETRSMVSVVILLCLSEGILLYVALSGLMADTAGAFLPVGLLSAVAGAYYCLQLGAYRLTGYVFETQAGDAVQWVRGFNASQCLLGLVLWIPALLALYNPDVSQEMVMTGGMLYVLARIMFISKGFRIFYDNMLSWVYFILYLCTLEIAPLFALSQLVSFLENL